MSLPDRLAAIERRAKEREHGCGDKCHDCTCCDDAVMLLDALRLAVGALEKIAHETRFRSDMVPKWSADALAAIDRLAEEEKG